MATVSNFMFITAGTSTAASSSFTLLSPGSLGTPTARRQLVHPDSVNFPTITYRANPDRTSNFVRGRVVAPPLANVRRSLGQSVVTRFNRTVRDMVVQEIWEGRGNKASMIVNFLVELLNYLNNPPTFVPSSPSYIRWKPLDGGLYEYDVELVSCTVGSGDEESPIDLREVGPDALLDGSLPTGVADRTVVLSMRVVEEFEV